MAAPAGPDDLYGLPLEEFTSARNALAKEMVANGDKAAAAEVKRLPKPNKTAWVLNQVARQRPDDVGALLEAGERLREAQEQALEGDAAQLRAATRAEKERVDVLVDAALEFLGSDDTATADRLRKTLRAAANEPGTGTLLREGRLVTDMETTGFGLEGLSVPTVDSKKKSDADDDERARRQERRQATREAERLQKEAAAKHNRARGLVDEAERAEQQAQQARREADAALEAATTAQQAADEAAATLGAATSAGDR